MDLHDLLMRNEGGQRMERFWVCYVKGTGGGQQHKHYLLPEAQVEAERLARKEGKPVYLLECIGECQVNEPPVRWKIPR